MTATGKKIFAFLTGGFLLAGLTGCQLGTDEPTRQNPSAVQSGVYTEESWGGDNLPGDISRLFYAGDKICVVGSRTGDDGSVVLRAAMAEENGTVAETIDYAAMDRISSMAVTVDAEGNLYTLTNEPTESGEPGPAVLVQLRADGKVGFQTKIAEDSSVYGEGLLCTSEERILVLTNEGLQIYDTMGSRTGTLGGTTGASNLYQTKDGRILLEYEGENHVLREADLQKGTLTGEWTVPQSGTLYDGRTYDLLLVTDQGIMGWNLGDEPKEMMNFLNSDFPNSYFSSLLQLDDGSFLGLYYGENGDVLGHFSAADPASVQEKTVLVLAGYGVNGDIIQRVAEFNKSSDQFRIQVKNYYTEYGEEGLNKLNNEIVSGQTPDILLIDPAMPVDSYIAKGVLADLNPFLDQDGELKREDFLQNIFEIGSKDGKWYQLIPAFSVQALAGKASVVGDGLTLEKIQQIKESHAEIQEILSNSSRDEVLTLGMQMMGGEIMEQAREGDSSALSALLSFAAMFPETPQYVNDDSYWNNAAGMYREGRTLLASFPMNSFFDYISMEQGSFGEPISIIGFPGSDNRGVINADVRLAICARSSQQQGAWQFLRYFLTDEFQSALEGYWPVSLSQLSALAEKATEKPSYVDENGQKVEYDMTFFLGDQELILNPLTLEETEPVKEYLASLKEAAFQNEEAVNIIQEEAGAYFSGQKSLDDTLQVIANRLRLYQEENS